jgi:hypothetical protein
MHCPKCGTENHAVASFCKHCGFGIKLEPKWKQPLKRLLKRRKLVIGSAVGFVLVLIIVVIIGIAAGGGNQSVTVDPQVSESKDFGVSVGPGGISFQNQHSYSGPSSQNPLQPQPSP